jgi:cation diffusion facilitator CzcD-associated flavoprotein CzcO
MAAVGDARFDAVIIGAGFSGLYMLYELRRQGLRTIVLEMADAAAERGWSTGIRAPGATSRASSTRTASPK